jgi:phosphoglycolate phosphatase
VSPAYDYWLFDLDGTLVDTEWSYKRELFDRVGDRIGRSVSDREARRLWYGLGGDRDAILRSWGVDPETFWEVFDALDDPAARAAATHLYDDAEPVTDLDRPTAVVTHCPAPVTDRVLDHLDVRDWFDAVVCCSAETGWKPDPAPVERATAAIGGEGRGVLVGDGEGDVGAAWNAGIDGIHVERHGPEQRGHCVLGDRRVSAIAELR